ncbi:Serine/threonine protein kinase, partial [Globisporangium polare]
MADAPVNIDDSLIPGMMSLNVVEALERAASLSNEMRESTSLCSRLIERLLFVREQLQTPSDEYARHLRGLSPQDRVIIATQLANAVGLVIGVFRTYAHKTALQRVAASRLIRAVVPVLHTKIDKVFTLAGLTTVPEMTAWKTQEESDISTQRRLLEVLVRNRSAITQDLSDSLREEALMEIRHEIDSQMSPRVFVALLEEALATVVNAVGGAAIPEVPAYYVRRDDIKIGEQIDLGSFGEVHKAKWGAEETDVVVKQLYM